MKKMVILLLCACLLLGSAWAAENEIKIELTEKEITVNGEAIGGDAAQPVYLARQVEIHEDVPEELEGLENRVVTIAAAGTYHISGKAQDAQIAVKAGENDEVRIILDGVDITCRTAPAIAVYTAADPRTAGEYGVTIELADGSENFINGSHTEEVEEDDVKLSGAITGLVSLGFEGGGSLNVEADNEGIEVKFGHMTFNGGAYHIQAGDDPINVSEDEVGVLTVNDGYLFSNVNPQPGGEGDGVDSNGYIVFNGGTIINLAHPDSGDSGIDSDMGSSINGGIVVGAGNMYDPIDANSQQLFMMLEFAEATDDLLVVTDAEDQPVFAYDFPHSYTYIAFSAPQLAEGTYHVYLGGEIEGSQQDGLYTEITAYTPGTQMQHGGGEMQLGGMPGMNFGGDPFGGEMPEDFRMPENMQAPEMPENMQMPQGMQPPQGDEMPEDFRGPGGMEKPDAMPEMPEGGFGGGRFGGFGGPRGMESSGETASTDFNLSRAATGFTSITAAK